MKGSKKYYIPIEIKSKIIIDKIEIELMLKEMIKRKCNSVELTCG